jgi:hypothetical protein
LKEQQAMTNITQASGRAEISVADAAAIAAATGAGDPGLIARGDLQALLGNSALVLDGQRRRPRYFDGRFLTGADMTRDQDYIRQRQNDVARAAGTGVINGLRVSMTGLPGGEAIRIEPGHGVTPTGDIVMVTQALTLTPVDLPTVEKLDLAMGLRLQPRQPLGRRTGLFLLTLRAVEFTANPIAAYPTTINGPRQTQDGDVIEATAITLIPWPDTSGAATLAEARRAAARNIFLNGPQGLPQDALPLAMIALDRGAVAWIDGPMVRREAGSETPLQASLASRPRALSEAFVLQYQSHLHDVLASRGQAGLAPVFSAAQYFSALPAAGQLPAACVLTDALGFRQTWFPPAIEADLSFVPHDELPALIEESLALPPIDLLASAADLTGTGVVLLAPVTRDRMRRFDQALANLTASTVTDPGAGVRRPPVEALAALMIRRGLGGPAVSPTPAVVAAQNAATSAWQAAWSEAVGALSAEQGLPPLLWYVRRRAVAYESRVAGVAVPVAGDDAQTATAVQTHLTAAKLADQFKAVTANATPAALARLINLLARPAVLGSTILSAALLTSLQAKLNVSTPPRPATDALVISAAAGFDDPRLGDGLLRLSSALGATPLGPDGELWLGGTGKALDVDAAARAIADTALPGLASQVAHAVAGKNVTELTNVLANAG